MKVLGEGDLFVVGNLYELRASAYHSGEGSIIHHKTNTTHDLGSDLGGGFPGEISQHCFFEARSLEHAIQIAKAFIGFVNS